MDFNVIFFPEEEDFTTYFSEEEENFNTCFSEEDGTIEAEVLDGIVGPRGPEGPRGQSGHSPYANMETNTWFQYDEELEKYVNTGIPIIIEALNHKLVIGEYSFDGSKDIVIPLYGGETN